MSGNPHNREWSDAYCFIVKQVGTVRLYALVVFDDVGNEFVAATSHVHGSGG